MYKKMYKNVLLLDGKIINWKTGATHWDSVGKAVCNRQPSIIYYNYGVLSVASVEKIITSPTENEEFFSDTTFYRQYELHEDYPKDMFKPY